MPKGEKKESDSTIGMFEDGGWKRYNNILLCFFLNFFEFLNLFLRFWRLCIEIYLKQKQKEKDK